jgi:gamma-glutamylcysteine synthetase
VVICGKIGETVGGCEHIRYSEEVMSLFLISNFHRVQYVVCFLLVNSPASEFYMSTFRNTVPSSQACK